MPQWVIVKVFRILLVSTEMYEARIGVCYTPRDVRFEASIPSRLRFRHKGVILSPRQVVDGDRAHARLPAPRVMHDKVLSPGLCQGFIHQCRDKAVMELWELTGMLCDFLFILFRSS